MTEPVTPLQLLVRPGVSGEEHLDFVENRLMQRAAVVEAREAGAHVPQVGSSALLTVARLLMERGFRVTRMEFQHPSLGPLDDESASDLSHEVVARLAEEGVASASRVIAVNGRTYLTGVEFYAPDGTSATLRRNGLLMARPHSAVTEALPQIWAEVEGHAAR